MKLFVTLRGLALIVAGLSVFTGGCQPLPASKQGKQADLIIKNVNVIDAKNGLRQNMNVMLQANKIVDVVPNNQSQKGRSTRQIDGSDKYLIPGLWDSHVHLTFTPELEDSMFALFIANGVTSVRDIGGQLEKVLAWREAAKTTLAPSVYIAGPLIDGVPTVYDGGTEGFPSIAVSAATAVQVEKIVDDLAAANVDLLKAYEMLTPEAFAALIKRAKHHALPVTGHVPLSMSAIEASAGGLRSMEHLRNLEMACSSEQSELLVARQRMLENGRDQAGSKLRSSIHKAQHFAAFQSYDPGRCEKVINSFAKNSTWQIPTLALAVTARHAFFAHKEWMDTYDYLPAPLRSEWRSTIAGYQELLKTPSEARDKRALHADWKMKMVNQLNRAGVKIMAGTDTPIFFFTPGFSLHKELETLVMAGMSPLQALESATLAPAEYFDLAATQGSIEAGMLADLVLLDANPLEDIRNTTKINTVIKNGRVLGRPALNKLLASLSK